MTTKEGNKLIAGFHGAKHNELKDWWFYDFNELSEFALKIRARNKASSDLQYHSSWDWLMPVIEKIENWTYRFHIEYCGSVAMPFKFYVFIDMYHVAGPAEEILETHYYDSKIKAAWNGIIQFIQWHNEKHKAQVSDTTEAK